MEVGLSKIQVFPRTDNLKNYLTNYMPTAYENKKID